MGTINFWGFFNLSENPRILEFFWVNIPTH